MQKKIYRGKCLIIGQNKLWWQAYSYKWLIFIFEEVPSEVFFGLGVKCLKWKWYWSKQAVVRGTLWLEAHSYKWLISIFEEVAFELLFGLALKYPWNGTEFVLIMFRIFKWVVFPYHFWKKINSFRILLGKSWYVFKPLLSDFKSA